MVFAKPGVLILIDEFDKERNPSQFQARFQAFNADGKAKLEVGPEGKSFEILRPNARLSGRVICESGSRIGQAVLDVPAEEGIFPYIETSTDFLKKCTFITICLLSPIPVTKEPKVEILRASQEYRIQFSTEKGTGTIGINLGNAYPAAQLEGI